MKNILLATTALVASAGIAAAEVAVTGYAEMGIVGGDANDDVTQFHTDIDVTFTMTGESDNGLTFGASVDLDEVDDGDSFSADTQGGETIFVSYGAATLTMGDTDGAFDKAMDDALLGDSINDAQEGYIGSVITASDAPFDDGVNGNSFLDGYYDGQIARVDYTFSGLTLSASVEIDDTGVQEADYAIGANYTIEMASLTLGVGAGYQEVPDYNIFGLSLDAAFNNGFQAIFNYRSTGAEVDTAEDFDSYGVSLGYTISGFDVAFNYGNIRTDGDEFSLNSYGASVGYDLGGGLTVLAGYGYTDVSVDYDGTDYDGDANVWSLGMAMSF